MSDIYGETLADLTSSIPNLNRGKIDGEAILIRRRGWWNEEDKTTEHVSSMRDITFFLQVCLQGIIKDFQPTPFFYLQQVHQSQIQSGILCLGNISSYLCKREL